MTKLELVTTQLVLHLERLSRDAVEIHWITAFAMKSGVRMILPFLQHAAERRVPVKLLVGDYLFVTQPEALRMLLEEVPAAEVRIWKSGGVSFHPKSYLFRGIDNSHLIVGSSNLSASALTKGVEWSLIAPTSVDAEIFEEAVTHFNEHFYAEQTIPLNWETLAEYKALHEAANIKRPISPVWSDAEEMEMTVGISRPEVVIGTKAPYEVEITPRPAQQEALQALDEVRSAGYERAMVVLATGLGKTYLAAFFAEKFKRVLFVAHREEILYQAEQSFKHVLPNRTTSLYNASFKGVDADFIFASVYTLGSQYHLDRFEQDAFDLIVIDEFHHAAAPTYQRLLEHFEPDFLLGITATPERMDNKDVYALCDGNVAISIHFLDAIEKEWLAPFKYYGVYDETNYDNIRWLGTRYDEEELLIAQMREDFAQKIYDSWVQYKQSRTIVFCSSVRQAVFMNEFFVKQGSSSIVLHGGTHSSERRTARERLDSGEVEVIFTVDLFNEGVDIPRVDTLLFIRPTESLTVYTQQIGRGLRIAEGKSHCVIIDFIGNYRNSFAKLQVFESTKTEKEIDEKNSSITPIVPDSCEFNLDLKVVNLFQKFRERMALQRGEFVPAYQELKREKGTRPSYLEYYLQAKVEGEKVEEEFDSYIGMLEHAGELTDLESAVWQKYKKWFLEIEKTKMTKSYKFVLLFAMLARGVNDWNNSITPEEAAPSFYGYLMAEDYRMNKDLNDKQGLKVREYKESRVASLIARMPMTMWSGSAKDNLISFKDRVFEISLKPLPEEKEILYNWTFEIAEYRLHTYFERKATNVIQH